MLSTLQSKWKDAYLEFVKRAEFGYILYPDGDPWRLLAGWRAKDFLQHSELA